MIQEKVLLIRLCILCKDLNVIKSRSLKVLKHSSIAFEMQNNQCNIQNNAKLSRKIFFLFLLFLHCLLQRRSFATEMNESIKYVSSLK